MHTVSCKVLAGEKTDAGRSGHKLELLRLRPSFLWCERGVEMPHAVPCRASVTDTDPHHVCSRQSTEAPSFGIGRVETDIKKSLEPVLKAYDNAQASKYAKEVRSRLEFSRDHCALATSTNDWCRLC